MEVSRILFETTYTKKDLHLKVMLLKEFFSNYFFKKGGQGNRKEMLEQFLVEEETTQKMKEALQSLPEDFLSNFTAENYSGELEAYENEMQNGPVLKMHVPTILPGAEVEKLGKWVRENIQDNIFMDLEVDPQALGGCMFVWNGIHHDYSFRYQFNKHRNEVKTLLRNFNNG